MSNTLEVRLEVPADVRFLRTITFCLEQILAARPTPPNPSLAHDLQLALQETCVNAIVHAYAGRAPGPLAVEFRLEDDRLAIVVTDWGKRFDPSLVREPNLESGQVHGYGLFLVKALLDDVSYAHADGENRWALFKRLA